MKRFFLLCPLLLVLFENGCVRFPLKSPPRVPPPLPSLLVAEFAYEPVKEPVVFDHLIERDEHAEFRFIGLCVYTPSGINKLVLLEYYLPISTNPVGVIVLQPVSAGKNYPLERKHFARYFVKRGYAVLLVRRDEKPGDDGIESALIAGIRQSVLDNRQVVDWILTRSELDPKRIGALGTSMGGIKDALLAPIEPRIKAFVLGLAGGDIPKILAYSKDGAWYRERKEGRMHPRRGITRRREQYMRAHGIGSIAEFETTLRRHIPIDPNRLALYADPSKALLILGACDSVVPFESGWDLRKRMGYPETLVLLSGHYSAALYLWYIEEAAFEFFERAFRK